MPSLLLISSFRMRFKIDMHQGHIISKVLINLLSFSDWVHISETYVAFSTISALYKLLSVEARCHDFSK